MADIVDSLLKDRVYLTIGLLFVSPVAMVANRFWILDALTFKKIYTLYSQAHYLDECLACALSEVPKVTRHVGTANSSTSSSCIL